MSGCVTLPTKGVGAAGRSQSKSEGSMQLDRQFVLDELRKAGRNQHVEQALQELPEKIDHDQHAQLLEKFGLDPGKLAEKAAQRGLADL